MRLWLDRGEGKQTIKIKKELFALRNLIRISHISWLIPYSPHPSVRNISLYSPPSSPMCAYCSKVQEWHKKVYHFINNPERIWKFLVVRGWMVVVFLRFACRCALLQPTIAFFLYSRALHQSTLIILFSATIPFNGNNRIQITLYSTFGSIFPQINTQSQQHARTYSRLWNFCCSGKFIRR